MPANPESTPSSSLTRRRRVWRLVLASVAVWAIAAYLVAPWLWKRYLGAHPGFDDAPRVTHTADGHPGDPINVALVGTEEQVIRAMTAALWFPADPITFRTSVRIAVDSVFRKPDEGAPVSNLFLFGRKQDLAFEQPVGDSPRQRHHVRFWRSEQTEAAGPLWFGSATFDDRVGLSYTTAQVTHHIGADVDAERDRLASELQKASWAQQVRWLDRFQQPEGRNGGGDLWRSDGRLAIVVLLASATAPATGSPPP